MPKFILLLVSIGIAWVIESSAEPSAIAQEQKTESRLQGRTTRDVGLVQSVEDLQMAVRELQVELKRVGKELQQTRNELTTAKSQVPVAWAYVDTRRFEGLAANEPVYHECSVSKTQDGIYLVKFHQPLKTGYRIFISSTGGWTGFTANKSESVDVTVTGPDGKLVSGSEITVVVFGEFTTLPSSQSR